MDMDMDMGMDMGMDMDMGSGNRCGSVCRNRLTLIFEGLDHPVHGFSLSMLCVRCYDRKVVVYKEKLVVP